MIRLVIKDSEGGEANFPVVESALIGRGKDCNLRLPSNAISRVHARIFSTPDGDFLEDLNTPNGTYLNGRKIEGAVAIKHGDVIQVGGEKIRIVAEEPGIPTDDTTTISNVSVKIAQDISDEADPVKMAWNAPLDDIVSKEKSAKTPMQVPEQQAADRKASRGKIIWATISIGLAVLFIVIYLLSRA